MPGLKNRSKKTPPGETSVWFPAVGAPWPMASSVDAEGREDIATKMRRTKQCRVGELMIVVSRATDDKLRCECQ